MGDRTWSGLLSALLRAEEISTDDAAWAMEEIMAGDATSAQIAGFALLLRAKGERPDEVSGLVATMLAKAPRVVLTDEQRARSVDVVGTGGDQSHTVNISTMAAIVVAGAGVSVVKHGNRAASSACGAADLLEHFGIPLDLGPDEVAACIAEAGIGFCFAGRFHPGMRHAGATRRELGVPTAFNFLGPLSNPGRPRAGAIGCADNRMAPVMAEIFGRRGDSVLIMHGDDGLDEFTTTTTTSVQIVRGGQVVPVTVDAADLGIARSTMGDLRGGDVTVNAGVARRLLAGERGPIRDAVLVNAAAALVAVEGVDEEPFADPRSDLTAALAKALDVVGTSIDSGAAAATLDRWITTAQSHRA
ncbi:anthranilate phosphoribosyltransferase [Allocatelliglobosispora scoriae]|uniref:Anthranilate phosphoribosyltransferase n=1 Tax=Allocatelliglobosispora scoriae TaxID=643052 RepID=A0A841BRW9_9ACTN|nr:anthranilate phosphoribosyltransferase [Allocatelliglobosispora scoriae]MBB5869472.1 anthranilate phosphoribosyltransferase [Allocatelliglobosispora scoriae]